MLEQIFDPGITRFDNFFVELTGIKDEASYNDTLALFNHKLVKENQGIVFNGTIPKPNDPELITSIITELKNMQIGQFEHADINLVSDSKLNTDIRLAFDIVLPYAISKENFSNITIQHNFIAKLMIWCSIYIDSLDFNTIPKCMFYGDIKRHEVYFLILLALIGVDVVYFNPVNSPTLKLIDEGKWCQSITLGPAMSFLVPLEDRVSKGVVVNKVTTYAKKASNELQEILYTDSGMYKPWQHADSRLNVLMMDSVIEDTITYWDEASKLRPGFKTTNESIDVPVFFSKINGVYNDINDYYELIGKLQQAQNCILYQTTHILGPTDYSQANAINYHGIDTQTVSTRKPMYQKTKRDISSLAFCLQPDKTINREEVKSHPLYSKMISYRQNFQDVLLNKIDEVTSPGFASFFNFRVTDMLKLTLMANIFTAEDKLLNMVEAYDYTKNIPKIIFYLNGRESFDEDTVLFIALLHAMGCDILFLSPNGANNIEQFVSPKFLTVCNLDTLAHDLPLRAPAKKKGLGGFFSRFK